MGGVETGRGKIAGGGEEFTVDPSIELFGEAAHDNTARERVDEETDEDIVEEIVINSSIEAILVAEERVDEFSVDPSIEAIQAAERIDKEAEGPRFESKLQ